MKIRDIPPGQFFILPRAAGTKWLKMQDKTYGIGCGKCFALTLGDGHGQELLTLAVWEENYDGDEYEIIPPEDV